MRFNNSPHEVAKEKIKRAQKPNTFSLLEKEFGYIDGEPAHLELRRLVGFFELIKQLRYRHKEEKNRLENHEVVQTTGAHIAMMFYLYRYFEPILIKEGISFDSEKVSDLILAHDIAEVAEENKVGIRKDWSQRMHELTQVAQIILDLPKRGGFNRDIARAFYEYVKRETQEARFVRALNGLASMMFLVSTDKDTCRSCVADNGYTKHDYRERIGNYTKEFPSMHKIYLLLERLFEVNGYFAKESENKVDFGPAQEAEFFAQRFTEEGFIKTQQGKITKEKEIQKLANIYSLKQRARFGKQLPEDRVRHPGDSVADHLAGLFILAKYFGKIEKNVKDKEDASTLIDIILAHDADEAIVGDTIGFEKTSADMQNEQSASDQIAEIFAPQAGKMQERYKALVAQYEYWKQKTKQGKGERNIFVFVKSLDGIEALFHLYDPEVRRILYEKEKSGTSNSRSYQKKLEVFYTHFPIIFAYYKVLIEKFNREGLF